MKSKKSKTIKFPEKYEMGSYVTNPWTDIYKNQIAMVKAQNKASNNPWTQGLDMVGGMAMQYGTNMMGSGMGQGQGKTEGGFDWGSILQGGIQGMGAMSQSGKFATGGVASNVPIEAEGEEVLETPQGDMMELEGPSHADGGIDMVVPEGTEIFSKKLKGPDGKSMATRKKAREKKAAEIEKLLEANPTDKALKKTLERITNNNSKVEDNDMMQMQFAKMLQDIQGEFETGGVAGVEKFLFGGPVKKQNPIFPQDQIDDNYQSWDIDANMIPDMIQSPQAVNIWDNQMDEIEVPANYGNRDLSGMTPQNGIIGPMADINPIKQPSYLETGVNPTQAGSASETSYPSFSGMNLTAGDAVGLMGQLYSTFGQSRNTQRNRAGDTPNINPYKDFGKDALKKMDQAKSGASQNRDNNLKAIELNRNAAIKRNRNSARGINTLRALDIASDMGTNAATNQVFNQFQEFMQNIYGQEAQLENQQDSAVMQGEGQRDIADRMDRDNYFSQMAKDISNKGYGLQNIGKTMNQVKSRNVTNKTLNSMYANFGIDAMSGEIKGKAQEVIQSNPTVFQNMSPSVGQSVIPKITKGTYEIVGDSIIDKKSGKQVDLVTGKLID